MEAGKMEKKKMPPPPTRLFTPYPPRSKDYCSGMHSTGHRRLISKPPQIFDYQPPSLKEAETIQRFCTELFAASDDGSSKKNPRPQFGSPTFFGYAPPVLKEVALDLVRYGGYTFPHANLGEASVVDAPDPSGQVGITTGYLKSNDSSVLVPVREVAALKIDEN